MAKKKVEKVITVVEQEEIQPNITQEEVVEVIENDVIVVVENDVVLEKELELVSLVELKQEVVTNEDLVVHKLSLLDSLHTPFYGKVLQLKEMVRKGALKQEILDELVGFQTISQEQLGEFISLL